MKKFNAIAAAIAAVCATGTVQAYDPGTLSTDYRVVISGATATTVTLRDVILRDVCTGSRDVYRYPASTNRYTIACTTAGGKRVMFMKNDGGSGVGVSPVDEKIPVSMLNTPSNTACGAGTASTSGFGTGYTDHNCGSTNASLLSNRVPDFGLSDIEPSKFVGELAPAEGSFKNVSNMRITPTAGLAFGVLANLNLYRALQVAQFPDSSSCSPVVAAGKADTNGNRIADVYEAAATNSTGTAPHTNTHTLGDTEACMPSLSTAQVRSLLMSSTLGVTSWDELKAKGSDLVALNTGKNYPWEPADATKVLCRRTTGSGTHALTAIKFLQTQCGTGATSGSQLMASGSNFATDCGNSVCDATLENTGSGGLVQCMTQTNTEGFWGIGYASLESNANLAGNSRFVKIDGVAPTLKNMVAGTYPIFGEVTAQSRQQDSSADYDLNNVPVAERANAKSNWATIVAELSSAANVQALNASNTFRHPFGDSGFLARGVPTSFSYLATSPIATQTHSDPNNGNQQNTCYGPVSVDGVSIGLP